MPRWPALLATFGLTLAGPSAVAAPTCLDKAGGVIRCGTPGAMPVGWTPSPEQQAELRASSPAGPSLAEAVAIIYVVGAVFALIALMPPFDGRTDEDWDEQEGDRRRRR